MPTELHRRQMAANANLYECLITPGLEKKAVDSINDYTRTRMRDEAFFPKLLPPATITNEDLDKDVSSEKPSKVCEMEVDSPAASTVPFGKLPQNFYMHARRYRVNFARVITRRIQKDVDELRTTTMDLRQLMSDNLLHDLADEKDAKFIEACNALMIGQDEEIAYNGNAVQWQSIPGGVSRESIQDAFKISPRTPGRLETAASLVNSIFIKELQKFYHDEVGGSKAQDILMNGWTETTIAGKKLMVTIKRNLVGDDTMFMFTDQKFIGKHFTLYEPVMYIENKMTNIQFCLYECYGASIANPGGLARADFE